VTAQSEASDVYSQVAAELGPAHPNIEPTRMFGSTGLKIHGKTFAMLVKGHLVVKLPRDRVDHLVDTGAGQRFDPGHGRQMREWVSLAQVDRATCRTLMAEALTFTTSSR
jgi:TfoX/Sxy family transcriptional regulator of competence genes